MEAGLDHRAVFARRVHAGVEGALVARAFDGDVNPDPASALLDLAGDVEITRVEDRGGAEVPGTLCASRVRLGKVDGTCPRGDGAQDDQRADGPGARHQHRVAGPDATTGDAVFRDGSRLDQCALFVGHLVGQDRSDLVVHDHGRVRHAAPRPTQSDAAHLHAEVVQGPADDQVRRVQVSRRAART